MDKRRQRSARKLDRSKALELSKQGFSPAEIAKRQGVASTTVWRFLQQLEPQRLSIKQFTESRAEAFALLQGAAIDVQHRLIQTMDDGFLASLQPQQRSGLLHTLSVVSGVSYDKERLERGKSTANHSVIHKMMADAIDAVHKPDRSEPEPEIPTTDSVTSGTDIPNE